MPWEAVFAAQLPRIIQGASFDRGTRFAENTGRSLIAGHDPAFGCGPDEDALANRPHRRTEHLGSRVAGHGISAYPTAVFDVRLFGTSEERPRCHVQNTLKAADSQRLQQYS